MGFRDLIKKTKSPSAASNTSDPSSNPYAQEQQPAGPPPDYSYDQYSTNQRIQQPPQGSYGGLPSGPRSGVVPGGVAPGFPTRSASSGPPTPQYPSPGAGPPPYGGSEYSPGFAGSTPVLPSTTSSPRLGSGYPKEKYGAQDGVGNHRWEAPAASPYGNTAPLPSQRQGAYGNLDAQGGGLFSGYNDPSRPAASSDVSRAEASGFSDGQQQPMTEEERQEAEVTSIKTQILQTTRDTKNSGRNALASAIRANEMMEAQNALLLQQGELLNNSEQNIILANGQVQKSGVHITDLNNANKSMFNLWANSSKNVAQQDQKRVDIDLQTQMLQARAKQQQDETRREWDAAAQRVQAPKPRGLLGAEKQARRAELEFEDDTGEQAAENDEIDEILDALEVQSRRLNINSKVTGSIIDSQLSQLGRMTDSVQVVEDGVTKQKTRLETRYLKK